ncbi:MAG: hypothetical protein ABIS18_10920 [Actinomycetota bacterium]
MSRRNIAIFVLAALLLVPAMALGLPRPTGAPVTGETFIETLTLSANSSLGVQTVNNLLSGRTYRLAVTGTWRHGVALTSVADGRWSSNDGWVTCLQTGKGLQVDAKKFGDAGSDLSCDKTAHAYSITIQGRGVKETMKIFDDTTYADNTVGNMVVNVYLQSSVTFVYGLNYTQDAPPSPAPQPYATVTVPPITPGAIPAVTISAVPVPGGGAIPYVGSVTYNHTGNQYCVYIQVQQNASTKLGCVLDEVGILPNGTTPIGGTGPIVQPTTVGPYSPVPGTPLPTVPGQTLTAGLPPGTTLTVLITWSADTTKLIPAASSDNTELWAPFAPVAGAQWFATNINAVAATITYTLKDGSGALIAPSQSVTVPGLGQVIEAIFASRVAGR